MLPQDSTFRHTPEEITAGMLLPENERVVDTKHIVPELELMLQMGIVPLGGITADKAPNVHCSPQLQEQLRFGLLDPNFAITSDEQRQIEGKQVADTAAAILTGLLMDNIFQDKCKNPDCSKANLFQQIDILPIPPHPPSEITPSFLSNAEYVLIDHLRHFLFANLRETLRTLSQDPNDPYQILCRNIQVATGLEAYDFISAGLVSQTNNLFAVLEVIQHRVRQDLPDIFPEDQPITRNAVLNIFEASKSAVLMGIAKNPMDIFTELVQEGHPNNPQVANGILSHGRRVDRRQGMLAPFHYNPEDFRIVRSEKPGVLGVLVLHDFKTVVDEARQRRFEREKADPRLIKAAPRITYQCPARAPRAGGKPTAIKYVHELAVEGLQRLNEAYERKIAS